MSNSNIFDQCTFFLSQVSNKSTVGKSIKDNGGQVVFMVTKNVTHFITNDKEFQSAPFNIKKAQGFDIHIVSEDFITQSISQNSRLAESDFTFKELPKPKQFSYFDSPTKSPVKNDPIAASTSTSIKSTSVSTSKSTYASTSKSTYASTSTTPLSSESPSPFPSYSSYDASHYSSLPTLADPADFKLPPKKSPPFAFKNATTPVLSSSITKNSSTSYTSPLESSITIASPFSSSKPIIEIKKNPSKVSVKLYDISAKDQPEFNSQSFEVLLSKTLQFSNFSGSSSNNKFYHIELQKDLNDRYRVYTSYGRSDGKRTNEVRYCKDLNESIDVFSSIYNEKTSDKKGYKEVDLVASSVASNSGSASFLMNSSTAFDSILLPPIRELIEHLYNEATTQLANSNTVKITERGLETPLGVLSLEQIEKGEKVLFKIKNLIESSGSAGKREEYEALSSEFYTYIPQSMGRGKSATDKIINSLNQLNMKFDLLQLMKDLLSIKDTAATLASGTSATDMKYYALKNQISLANKFSQDYKTVIKMAEQIKGVKVSNVFALNRESDTPSFGLLPSPTKLLLHGTRPSNIVGILSRGMLLPKVITDTGVASRTDFGFLGYGIYYGSSFETACKYAHPSTTSTGLNKRYAIVSRVALGKHYPSTKINSKLTEPPAGFDSCLGLKNSPSQKSDFHDDEYVIYDSKRQRQEFLVEFTYDGDSTYNPIPSSSSITSTPAPAPASTKSSSSSSSSSYSAFSSKSIQNTPIPTTTTISSQPPKLINPTKPSSSLVSSFSNLSISKSTAPSVPAFASTASVEVDQIEDGYRKMFVNDRNNSTLSNKFLYCEKLFSTRSQPKQQADSIKNDLIMGYNSEAKSLVKSQNEFNERWNKFTNNYFDGFNWNNTFVAGGSVLGCSLENVGDSYSKSDIDIFLYGLSESEANKKLESIEQFIKRKSPKSQMARTKYAVTFLNDAPLRNIQIVLRIYKTPAEVLMGFDIDCCSIGFDGSDVYAIPRAINSIANGYNVVSMSRRSLTYETRLFKYALRGFAIKIPNFSRSQIPIDAYSNDIKGSSGLLKLLLLEHKYTTNKSAVQFLMNNSGSDYNSIEIPSGPYWTVPGAVSFINYKEKSQFFAKKKDGFKHCHMIVVGDNAKDGKASWCKKCQSGEKPQESATQDVVVGPIQWVTENPGAQLLTGSFHPVSDDKWFDIPTSNGRTTIVDFKKRIINNQDVSDIPDFSPKYNGLWPKLLVDSNHLLCIAAAFGSDVSMRSMMPIYKIYINTSDEFGYYPIHYAAKSGNLECVNLLLENNCLVPARSLSYGVTAGMVAYWYDRNKIYNSLYNKCPRISKVKSRTYPHRTIYQWGRFADIHKVPPVRAMPGNINSQPEEIWGALLSGNSMLVKSIINSPSFKESTDPLGNSLFHYAILSPLPKEMFTLLKNKGYSATRVNIFGQSVYDFGKSISGDLVNWVKDKIGYNGIPSSINFVPIYLMNEIDQLLKELPNPSNNVSAHSLPLEYIYNFPSSKTSSTSQLLGSTIQSKFSSLPAAIVTVPDTSSPPKPSFGFGGKFSAQPPKVAPPPAGFGYTGFGFGGATTNTNSPPLSPSQFVLLSPSNSAQSLPSLSLANSNPYHQHQLPESLRNANPSFEDIKNSLSTPKNVDIKSKEFLESSRVAQILSLVDQFCAQGRLTPEKASRIKTILFEIYLPIFNAFESYYLYQDTQALLINIDMVLDKYYKSK